MGDESYQSVQPISIMQENEYELAQYVKGEIESQPHIVSDSKSSHQSVWSIPVIIQTVLMCIILLLLVTIIIMTGLNWTAQDATGTGFSSLAMNNNGQQQFPNFTQWVDDIVTGVYQSLDPSLSSLSDDVTLVLSLITQLSNAMQAFHENNTLLFDRVMETVSSSVIKLSKIIGTLSNIQNTSTSTAGVVDDILIVVQELLVLHNVSSPLPTSNETNCTLCTIELCGSGGGWTRLAYLNMSNATVNCPSGFRLYQSGGVRACGRPVTSSGSCVSVEFPSNGISYSQVCGRVTGYQYASPDAVRDGNSSNHNNLNGDYVDGVSITRGSPRQHVWTLMAGVFGNIVGHLDYICPCANDSTQQAQSFVGDHYFCETAIVSGYYQQQLYTSDPLWDGQGCGSTETACCNVPGIPWFHRDYGNTTTTDYIELRVCGDEGTANEDTPVSYYEIYVK